jgi:Protein of unknown function (DUF4239)
MTSMEISWIVFGIVFGGALAGMTLRALLPEHHLSPESKDVVKLVMGLIGTLSALVLGLLIASAKSSFDAQRSGLAQLSANMILLDRLLAHYGPETKDLRASLRGSMEASLQRIWPEDGKDPGRVDPTAGGEELYERLQALTPHTESQRMFQASALKTAMDVGQARWLMFAQKGSAIPTQFLVVLVFWLAMLFASFSLFAKPNATIIIAVLVCALSVSGAIFLILELDRPFEGLIKIPSEPMRRALEQMGR